MNIRSTLSSDNTVEATDLEPKIPSRRRIEGRPRYRGGWTGRSSSPANVIIDAFITEDDPSRRECTPPSHADIHIDIPQPQRIDARNGIVARVEVQIRLIKRLEVRQGFSDTTNVVAERGSRVFVMR